MLAAESGRQRAFLERVVDSHLGLQGNFQRQPTGFPNFSHKKYLRTSVENVRPTGTGVCVLHERLVREDAHRPRSHFYSVGAVPT